MASCSTCGIRLEGTVCSCRCTNPTFGPPTHHDTIALRECRAELADYVSRQPSAHVQRIHEAEGALLLEKARHAETAAALKYASEQMGSARAERDTALGHFEQAMQSRNVIEQALNEKTVALRTALTRIAELETDVTLMRGAAKTFEKSMNELEALCRQLVNDWYEESGGYNNGNWVAEELADYLGIDPKNLDTTPMCNCGTCPDTGPFPCVKSWRNND